MSSSQDKKRSAGKPGSLPVGENKTGLTPAIPFCEQKSANMVRGPLQVTCLIQQPSLQQHWARRSVFYLDGKGILVTEVFMPPMATISPQDV